MGTLRTIAFLFLLCCAVVEQNNAVPIPPTTAAPALPLETEFYTETYTEFVNETVLFSDTEGTIQQRQERPLTGPVAKPSTDTRRDDHQQSINAEASDGQDQNDALGGNADNVASSDTDTKADGTDLISSEHNSTDADAIVNGENDTHSSPHDGVNTTAASTRSSPLALSAMHLNTSFISVSTGEEPASPTPIVVSSTPLVVGSISQNTDQIKHSISSTLPHSSAEPLFADRMAMTPYDTLSSQNTIASATVDTNFTPDNGDITPTPSGPSSSAPDLTPNKGMLTASVSASSATHHASASPPDSSAGKSIAQFPEPVATEIYTEIMEITELVMSDTESESVEGSEQSSVIGNTEHETDQTPQLTMPITHTTGSVSVSTSLMSDTSSVRPYGSTLGMVMTHYTKLSTEEITASLTSSRSTPDSLNITLEQSDIAPEPSDSTPEQFDIAPEPSDIAREPSDITPEQFDIIPEQSDNAPEASDIAPEASDIEPEQSDITPEQSDIEPEQSDIAPEQYSIPNKLALYVPDTAEVTSSSELFVTETYTEIMEITELSMSDTASDTKSEETILAPESEDSVQKKVNTHEGEDDDYTPSSDENQSLLTPNAIVSTLATPALVQESTIESLNKSSIGPHGTKVHVTQNITMSNTREISTALVDTISTLEISDFTLDNSDSTPDSPDYTLDSSDTTPESPDYTLDSLDSTLDSSDSTQDSSDSIPDNSDSTPDSPDYTLDSSDTTPDSPDSIPDNSDSTPDSPDYTLDSSDPTPDSPDSTLNNPDYTLDSSYSTPDSPDTTPDDPDSTQDSPDTTLNNPDSTPKDTIDPSTTAESTLDEPSNPRYPASTTKDTPNGDSVTPSQEHFVTELYTEIMEITEILMSAKPVLP